MKLQELVTELKALKDFDSNVENIQELMGKYTSNPEEWKEYCFREQGCYTRNLIFGNESFNLMLLCWDSNVASPIHDHSDAHCILKVLKGSLQESLYDWNVNLSRKSIFEENQVTYMHDKIGLHSIDNPSSTDFSVSLHLYSPPFDYCKTFCPRSKQARKSGKCLFYSVDGKKSDLLHKPRKQAL